MRRLPWIFLILILLGVATLIVPGAIAVARPIEAAAAPGRAPLLQQPQPVSEPHLKEFEALTGMKLVVEVYPEDQFRAKTVRRVAVR